MATWIKICGLTSPEDAALAVHLGADALGFVLHRESKRFCAPDIARSLVRKVSSGTVTVGVWFDESAEDIYETARFIGCQWVQTYDPRTAHKLFIAGFDVLPAIPIAGPAAIGKEWRHFCQSWSGRVILDRSPSLFRKARLPEDKRIGARAGQMSACVVPERMILAGGLNAENIRSELNAHRPTGVDVSSGVESVPGRKNPEKLVRFIEEVRRWDATVSSGVLAGSLSPKR